MHKINVRLWGGPQDGHNTSIVVQSGDGPPSFLAVPARTAPVFPAVLPVHGEHTDQPMASYRLDVECDNKHYLLYRYQPEEVPA